MLAYIARRLLLVVPTLFGIMLANFIIVQAAPGGPVDLMLARLRGHAGEATVRVASTGVGESGRAARGVGEEGDTWAQLSWPQRTLDYLWHIALPVTALVVGGFASLAMLTKNSFLDEINKQYVATARAKGLSRRRVLYGHIFRNAMLIVIAGFPGAFIGMLFAGELLIEVIFSLNGLGLLGFEAAVNRDYPVMFGTLYLYTLIGLLLNIVTDLTYTIIDPRIDFERRAT